MMALAPLLVLTASLTLDEVRAASRQNLDALKAELEVRRQQQAVTVARSPIWPQLQLSSQVQGFYAGPQRVVENTPVLENGQVVGFRQTVGNLDVSTSRANFNLAVQVSQLIYDGGKWWNQISLSQGQQRAAEGQLEEQRLVSELEAVSRFYALLGAQVSQSVLENAVKRSEVQVDRAGSLFEAGRAPKLDALDAAVNLGNDRINVLRQKERVTGAQVDLLKWLGQPTREVEAADPGTMGHDRPAPAFAAAAAAARRHRPLLRALDAQVEVAARAVDVAFAGFLPTVSVVGGYQRQAPTADPFFTDPGRNNAVYGGFNLSWNVFNGFATRGTVDQARETLAQARLTRDRAEVDLDGDLRRALKSLETQLEVQQIADANLKLAESALKLAEERFAAGAGSTLEVRDAQVKLTGAQLSRLQSRLDVEIARESLRRVVGGGVEESP